MKKHALPTEALCEGVALPAKALCGGEALCMVMSKAWLPTKTLLVMKLTAVLLIAALTQVSAKGIAQKITLSGRQVPLVKVFKEIKKQSGYRFFYEDQIIQQVDNIDIDVKNAALADVLNYCLQNQSLTWEIIEKTIVIKRMVLKPLPPLAPMDPIVVNGRVTDEEGRPMTGVTVAVAGSSQGTQTNENGNFTLTVNNGDVLRFSYVGYEQNEVIVKNRTAITVVLKVKVEAIKDVVVVAYGTQKRANVTGAVASITSKELNTTTNSNLTNMMAGKLPGLRVTQRTAEPGSYNTYFDIRGMGTPLIVVDGVVREDFVKIDPNEIESVSILKDASAAVYGVKAANGVLLITTKRGKAGKATVQYSGTYGWANLTNTPDIGNAVTWMTLTNENKIYTGWLNNRVAGAPVFTAAQIQEYADGTKQSTDWASLALRDYTPQQHHNLSVSGGTDKVKYFMSLGFFDEQGLWKSGDLRYKRYNFRTNLSMQLTKNLDAELLMDGIVDKKQQPGGTSDPAFMVKSMWMQIPTLSVYANDNPAYLNNAVADGTHPLAITSRELSGYIDNGNKSFQGSLAFNYRFPMVPGLKARYLFSYYNIDNNVKYYKKSYALYDYDAVANVYKPTYQQSPSYLRQEFLNNYKTMMQTSLDYEHVFGGSHTVKGLLLFEQRTNTGDNFFARRDLVLDAIDQLYAGTSLNQQANSNSGLIYDDVNKGLVGRFNYDFRSKYIVEFAFRYDGSSKFPKDKRWGFFPSVSAGWRLSEESFIREHLHFVDNLKLRASWGRLGDDAASSFQFIQGVSYPSGNYYFGNSVISGTGFTRMINPNITWYESDIKDIGIEAALWKNKLKVEFDVFQRDRSNLLATRALSLPNTVGAGLPQENLNSDMTRGYELLLSHSSMVQGVRIDLSANLTYARTKLKYQERSLPGNSWDNFRNNTNDRWNNVIWGYHCLGQFQSFEEILSSPVQDGNGNRYLLPGDLKYEDVTKDGIINGDDQMPIGRGISAMSGFGDPKRYPEYNYGFSIGASWNGFDLFAQFQGSANYYIKYVEQLQQPLTWGRNGLIMFMDRWHQADPLDSKSTWIPGKFPLFRESPNNSNYAESDFWLYNASYLKLKSVELGYSLPMRLLKNSGISNVRIYVNGFNLYTWSKLDFIDPEHTADNYGYLYPITRNYNIGLNVSF